jgi:hypothetical protein
VRELTLPWPTIGPLQAGAMKVARSSSVSMKPRGVLDANVLCRHPSQVVEEWCERMSLPYDPEALTWKPGMRPEWELWGDWHASTARSTGFGELRDPPPPPTPDEPHLHEAYQEALPVYRRMAVDATGADHSG